MTLIEFNTGNPELQTKKIVCSDHAYRRAAERLGIKSKNEALGQLRSYLRQATKIGLVTAEDGRESILYAYGRVAIHLSTDLTTIITVKRIENLTYVPLKEKAIDLHRKEINKIERIERSLTKKLNLEKLRINAEVAQLEYRKVKTRSNSVQIYCDEKIKSLKSYIKSLELELDSIKSEKRQVANSMVSIL